MHFLPPGRAAAPHLPMANGCASGKAWRIWSLGHGQVTGDVSGRVPGHPFLRTVWMSVSSSDQDGEPHPPGFLREPGSPLPAPGRGRGRGVASRLRRINESDFKPGGFKA